MHRQSLGSPSPKLHNHGVINEEEEQEQEKVEELPKTQRLSSPPHNFLHLIPILTLLCFFLLYLFSHPLSPSELDQFTRFNHHHNNLETTKEIRVIDKHYVDGKRGDVLVLGTLRNLQHIRLHRKLADF
ncbi:hypothetical protein TanjilG_20649 [Lupinus angustifolius]|uniref:Uncharacterized protein n=1 Tax=Lupinus angustifolius TaxID=3871 RepID=A0A4P1QRD7_LUPAN|nr:PREDICTED: uncharacterized protein LOC109332343 [Lupinus angustifolius]OIV92987.1 hypothetical protein TanjilG_20649 [Lupinus angustifolius]